MSSDHQERPSTRWERSVIAVLAVALLLGGYALVVRIGADRDHPHAVEFVLLALVIALAAYLGLLYCQLETVRYVLQGNELRLSQGFQQVTIDLSGQCHLHRWRSRWGWSGGARRDLGVEEIELFPSLVLMPRSRVWVVEGLATDGTRRAVALQPSPGLTALLKERIAGGGQLEPPVPPAAARCEVEADRG